MADKYYRKITKSIDDTKYKLQLAAITLKINKNDIDIKEIKNNISKIKDSSGKTNTNENNISSNLEK